MNIEAATGEKAPVHDLGKKNVPRAASKIGNGVTLIL